MAAQQMEEGGAVTSMCGQSHLPEDTLAEDWTAAFESARAEWQAKRDADQVQLAESLAKAYATLGVRPAWWQRFLHMPWVDAPQASALEGAHSALRKIMEQLNADAFMEGASKAYKDEILDALGRQLKTIESLSGGSYTRAWQMAWGESPHEGIARLQSKVSSWDARLAVEDVTQVARIEKVVATDLQEGVVGQPLSLPVTVRVSTSSGEPVVGATVTFKRAGNAQLMFLPHPGQGGAQSELQAATDEHGHASVRVVPDTNIARSAAQRMGTYAAQHLGYNLVTAETSNGTQVFELVQPFALIGLPDAPASLLGNFDTTPTEPGLQMMGPLNARVVDQYGNNLANEPVVWTQLDPTGRFFSSSMVNAPQVLDYSNPLQLLTATGWSLTSGYQSMDYIPGPTSGTYRVTATSGSLTRDFDISATASTDAYVLRAPSYDPYLTVYGLHSSRVSKFQVLHWPQGATGWTPLNGNEPGLQAAEVKIATYVGFGPGGSSSNLLASYVERPALVGVEPLDDEMSVVHRVKALVAPSATVSQPYQNYLVECRVFVVGRPTPVSCRRGIYNPSRSVVPSLRLARRLPDGRIVSSEGEADASDLSLGFTVNNGSSDKLYVRMIVQSNEAGDAIVTGFGHLPLDSDGDAEIQATASVTHLFSLNPSTRGGSVRFELYAKDHLPTSVTKVLQAVREFDVSVPEPELVLSGLPLAARWVLPAWDFVSGQNPVPGQPLPEDAQVPVAYPAQLGVTVYSDGVLRISRGGTEISSARVYANAANGVTQVTPLSGMPIVMKWNSYAVVELAPGAAGVETIGVSFQPTNANGQMIEREVPLKTSVMSEGRLPVGHTFIKGVSLVDGHLVKQAVDLEYPSRGLGLTWSRTYASGESEDGVLGLGWTHAYNGIVRPLAGFRFLVTSGEGGGQVFKCTGDGTGCVPQQGYHGTFRAEGAGAERAYVFRAKSGVEYRYGLLDSFSISPQYRLTSVVAPTGHSLVLHYHNYSGEGALARVVDLASGRSLRFGYERKAGRNRILNVELHHSLTPDANEVEYLESCVGYEYDDNGRLASASRYSSYCFWEAPLRTEFFTYEEGTSEATRSRMSQYVGPDGEVTRYTYYAESDVVAGEDDYLLLMNKDERVKEVIEVLETSPVREGITTFTYSVAPESRTILGENLTTYTTTVGGPRPGVPLSTYRMNATGAVVETDRPQSPGIFATSSALWNVSHRTRVVAADERGRVTHFLYDETGNLIERRVEGTSLPGSGLVAPTLQVLDAQGLPVEEVVEKWGYDPGFNVQVCHVDPEGFATVSTIDSTGDSPEHVVPEGTGRVLETRRYANRVSRQALTSTAPCDEVVASLTTSPQDVVSSWEYCEIGFGACPPNALRGDLSAVVGADGHTERVTAYDIYGQMRSKTLQVSDTSVLTVQSTFDARGRLEVEQDGLGRHRTLQWDALDRLTQEVQWSFGDPGVSRTLQYHAGGQLKREEQGADFVRDYHLDAAGRLARIVESGGGLAVPLETRYGYDEAGNRTTVIDRRGVLTTTTYDFADRPVQVTVSVADGPRFVSQGGSPDEVGKSYVLSTTRYDAAGNKVWHSDVSGFDRTYRLDSLYRVVEEHSPEVPGASDTAPPLRYTQESRYDLAGRKVRHVDGNGHVSTTAYDLLGRAVALTDPLGRVERRSYDGRGNVTEVRWETGGVLQRTLSTTYDGLGRTLSTAESAATETGNVVYASQTVHDDVAHVTWTQNARGLLQASHLDGLGRVFKVVVDAPAGPLPRQPADPRIGPALALTSTVEYDAFSREAARVDALGRRTETVHDALGRQVAVHHPMGVSTSRTYDGEGNPIQFVDGRGITRQYTYDALGRPRNEVLVESLSQEGQSLVVAQRAYVDVTDADALTHENVLDARGNLTAHYRDGLGREVRRVDALGYVTQSRFDALHKRQTQDAKGYISRFSYDGAGRVVGQSDHASASGAPTYSQTWEYADASREQTHLNRRGVPTVLLHDGLGRKIRSVRGQNADVAEESWEYDAAGHPIRFVDAKGHATERLYDGAGRLLEEVLAAGTLASATTTLQYDAAGQLTQTKGPRVTGIAFDFRYTYDDLGRRVREENALNQITAWAYDAAGNKVCTKQPLGQPTLAHGAASGMSLAQVKANACGGAYVTEYAYDEEGKLVSITDAANGLTSYVYDATRNLVARQDANGNLTTYEYDARNLRSAEHQHLDAHSRLTSAQRESVPLFESGATPTGSTGTLTWRHTYDGNRNEASHVDPKGQRVEFAHGLLDRLASRTYSQHASPRELPSVNSEVLAYDPNGNLTGESQSKQTVNGVRLEVVTSTFDALDRLKTRLREYDGKQVSYQYDALGNRTRVEDSDGVATTYLYDGLSRLTHATLPEGVVEYRYWPDSLPKGITWPNGMSEGRCYDAVGRLSQIVVGRGGVSDSCLSIGAMVSRHAYSYDDNGNRLGQTRVRTNPSTQESGSPEFTSYGYDVLNRLTGVSAPDGQASLYRWDAAGNRTGERRAPSFAVSGLGPDSYNTVLSHELTYDVAGIFNRVDWLRGLRDLKDATRHVALSYDLAGNITRRTAQGVVRDFAWDIRNTLTAVYDNGVEVGRYDYDASLQRTVRRTASEHVEYVIDDAFVLEEADGSQSHRPTRRRYHYGIGPLAVSDVASATLGFLGTDALGSVTDVLSEIGQVSATREYDAWGNYQGGSAPSVNDFKMGFTGHQYDVETGLTYARARYYDSELGRFLSRDSFEGVVGDAPSLHRYMYANGNPLRFVDPTGHWSTEQFVYGLGDVARGIINSGIGAVRPLAAVVGGATGEFDENWRFQLGQTDTWHGELSNSVGGMVAAVTTVVEDPFGTAMRVVDATGQMLGEGTAALYVAATEDGIVGDAASREFGRRAPDLIGAVLGVGGTAKGVKVVGESAFDAAKRQVAKRGARNVARESAEAIGDVDRRALARAGTVGDDVATAKLREVEVSAPDFSDLDEWYQYKERYVDPQAFIDNFIVENRMRVEFTFKPGFEPRLKSSGKAKLDSSTQIGESALIRDSELFKTLAHEEAHHRLNERAKRGSGRAERLRRTMEVEENYVEEVAKRYFRKKSLGRTFAH
ncbi:RHS repeat-associated core domain-containing protein [Myxococcus hansupus]|uniref:RHS repeat-associated core domain-containing protein n=1 Tax=Pseudomyxococcus hansupus TaxID=1297742 RepID=UPI001D038E50|nr:RHS repeat-associated core domain-containing protein [Myxococcus hansupus]